MVRWLPMLLMPFLYAAMLKLAAWAGRRLSMRWRHALAFGLFALALALLGGELNQAVANRWPPWVIGALGLSLQVGLGAWFFASRVRHPGTGAAVGRGVALLLCLAALAQMVALGLLTAWLQRASA